MTYLCIKLALQGLLQQKKDFLGFWNIAETQSEANMYLTLKCFFEQDNHHVYNF